VCCTDGGSLSVEHWGLGAESGAPKINFQLDGSNNPIGYTMESVYYQVKTVALISSYLSFITRCRH